MDYLVLQQISTSGTMNSYPICIDFLVSAVVEFRFSNYQQYSICGKTRGGSAIYFWLILTFFWGFNTNFGGWETPEGVKPPTPRQIEHNTSSATQILGNLVWFQSTETKWICRLSETSLLRPYSVIHWTLFSAFNHPHFSQVPPAQLELSMVLVRNETSSLIQKSFIYSTKMKMKIIHNCIIQYLY